MRLSLSRHKQLECKHPIHIMCCLKMPSNYTQTITTHFCTFFCYLSVIHNYIKQLTCFNYYVPYNFFLTKSYQDIIIVIFIKQSCFLHGSHYVGASHFVPLPFSNRNFRSFHTHNFGCLYPNFFFGCFVTAILVIS